MNKRRLNKKLVGQVVEKLKVYRQECNLTLERVSDDTGLNVGRIETGEHDMNLTTLADLCDYYGKSPADFFQELVTQPS